MARLLPLLPLLLPPPLPLLLPPPPLPLLLPLLPLLLLLPMPLLPMPPSPPPGNASLPGCHPDEFQCKPRATCFPREWLCDGHPDCEDEADERSCGTATPAEPSPDDAWVTPPRSSAVLPTGSAEASATSVPGGSVPLRGQGRMWILIIAAADLQLLANAVERQPSTDVQTRYDQWFSACALSSLVLLSILVAVGSIAAWGLSKAKGRSDIFSVEKASREQLMPDKSQAGSLP